MKIRLHVPTIGIATYQFAKCSKMEINVTSAIVDNHAMPMCSIAASGSTADSNRLNIEVLLGSCMVASASDGISGVCSVARQVRVERFLEVLPWFNGLFPIDSIARNAARTDVHEPKELARTNHGTTVKSATTEKKPGTQAIGGWARQV